MEPASAIGEVIERGLRSPRSLTLALTSRCNLACQHCLVDAGPAASNGYLPTATVRRLIGELATLGGEEIWLTGGEPLLHPDFLEILNFSHESLSSVCLQTNAMLLGPSQVEALRALANDGPRDKSLSIKVSLDGACAATHDRVRGRGSFDKAIAGVRLLTAAGLSERVSIAFTEMRQNMDEVGTLLELVADLGVHDLVSGTLVEDGRAAQRDVDLPAPEQYRALLARWQEDPKFRALYDRYATMPAIEWWKGRGSLGADCCRFVDHPYLTAQGTLYPCALCRADEYAVGGVFEKPLAAAVAQGQARWSALQELKRRRHGNLPACQACVGRLHCGGGCVGRAFAASGTLMEVEDRCALRKAVYYWGSDGGPRAVEQR
jgi:radical SAM protein with 4Fe4S-binding SPASM domain